MCTIVIVVVEQTATSNTPNLRIKYMYKKQKTK